MNRHITLYTNRITWDIIPILTYAKDYYAVHKINLIIKVVPVDVPYESYQPEERPGISYWIVKGNPVSIDPIADVTMFMFDQADWRTPPGSPYPLLPNTPTSDCIVVEGKPYINYGAYSPDLNGAEITFIHENIHALVKEANLNGFPTQDLMDATPVPNGDGTFRTEYYYLNNTPDAPNGNFIQTFECLYPYLKTKINYETA